MSISLQVYDPNTYYGIGSTKERVIDIEINPGYTALVGPNGTGKSTFLQQIQTFCEKNGYKYLIYDNMRDGRHSTIDMGLAMGNISDIAAHICNSEGEGIIYNIGNLAAKVGRMCYQNGLSFTVQTPVFVLLDGIDSGMSIDKLWSFRHDFADFIISEERKNNNPDLYIITTANNYELVNRNADCINVITGKHMTFDSYDSFEEFIFRNSKEEFSNGKPEILSKGKRTKSSSKTKTNRAKDQ